jgi:hypothetical protein
MGKNSCKKKGPCGPDGLRHPPPESRIDISMYQKDAHVKKKN